MLHSTTGFQSYEIIFGCKTSAVYDAWLELANNNDQFLQRKCVWINEQHELILSANRHVLKEVKITAE